MIRKQVYIEQEQDAALKRLAAEAGVTEAALIREGIDLLLEQRRLSVDREAVLAGVFGLWQDRQDDVGEANRQSWRRRRERLAKDESSAG